MKSRRIIFTVIVFLLITSQYSWASKRYVVQGGSGTEDGTSWSNASGNLQDMIDDLAQFGVGLDTIWIAAGTYFLPENHLGDKIGYRIFEKDVKIFGGFDGTESNNFDLDLRDLETNETIINGSGGASGIFEILDRTNNTVIDGLTFINGQATGGNGSSPIFARKLGGAMRLVGSSILIRHCTFKMNHADENGGAVWSDENSIISDCVFQDNTSKRGGGIYQEEGNIQILHSVFISNHATLYGGTIYNDATQNDASTTLDSCVIYASQAQQGGAIYNIANTYYGHVLLDGCVLVKNISLLSAAGIANITTAPETDTTLTEMINTVVYNIGDQDQFIYSGTVKGSILDLKGDTRLYSPTFGLDAPIVLDILGDVLITAPPNTFIQFLEPYLTPEELDEFGIVDGLLDIDGNSYRLVTIGNQTWMAENLRVAHYNDGAPILHITDNMEWSGNDSIGAYSWYSNDSSTHELNFGKLYNWYTVETSKLCPAGWHVPSNSEWLELINAVDGISVAGGKLKEMGTQNWNDPNQDGTDEYDFTARPGGIRLGAFNLKGAQAVFWSDGAMGTNSVTLFNNQASIDNTIEYFRRYGASVRCVKD